MAGGWAAGGQRRRRRRLMQREADAARAAQPARRAAARRARADAQGMCSLFSKPSTANARGAPMQWKKRLRKVGRSAARAVRGDGGGAAAGLGARASAKASWRARTRAYAAYATQPPRTPAAQPCTTRPCRGGPPRCRPRRSHRPELQLARLTKRGMGWGMVKLSSERESAELVQGGRRRGTHQALRGAVGWGCNPFGRGKKQALAVVRRMSVRRKSDGGRMGGGISIARPDHSEALSISVQSPPTARNESSARDCVASWQCEQRGEASGGLCPAALATAAPR